MSGRSERDMQDIFSLDEKAVEALSFSDMALARLDEGAKDDLALELIVRAREASARYAWLPYMHSPSLAHRLHRIKMPALVISGEQDRVISAEAGRKLAKRLPRGEFAAVSECGHYPHIERAELTAHQVIRWRQHGADTVSNAMKGVA
jgi:pimeloyl-ACP methyl ester carboxylesterase